MRRLIRVKAADRLLDEYPENEPGVGVVVLRGDAVEYHAHRGLANVERRIPIDENTAFDLASVSKHFTAVAVLVLERDGKLRLDDEVQRHLPEWSGYPSGRPLRLDDLLLHTSGLRDYLWFKFPLEELAPMTNEEFLARVRAKKKPAFGAGTQEAYSNTNFILLAEVVRAVSRMPFAEFLRKKVFAPLGMTGSVIGTSPTQTIPNRATGYRKEEKIVEEFDHPISLHGHSHLFTTTADLAKWFGALWSGKVVPVEAMRRAITPGRFDDGRRRTYGYGWSDDAPGLPASTGHGGYWDGFVSHVRHYPKKGFTIAVVSNYESRSPGALIDRLEMTIPRLRPI